jgi:outer membrane protein OmpA-like peptidoglycan-associated protein/osmotically-inducible protein OsmY
VQYLRKLAVRISTAVTDRFTRAARVDRRPMRRAFVRLPRPRWAFLPWGALPLVGFGDASLIAVTSFADTRIERSVREHVAQALSAKGCDWVQVRASGQVVTLSGIEPFEGDAQRALAIARLATCPTWAGEAVCATEVKGSIEPPPKMPDYVFAVEDGTLFLAGSVPDETVKARIHNMAKGYVGLGSIEAIQDVLRVTGKPAPAGYAAALERGVDTVARCLRGEARLERELFSISCDVTRDEEASLQTDAMTPLVGVRIGRTTLVVSAADTCEKEFASMLLASPIQFRVGSAQVDPANTVLLDSLVDLAKRCPGDLRVEGYTDGTGDLVANLELSRERAAAVRAALIERGVEDYRIAASGLGPARAVGDNTTERGRALNRRIEIHAARANTRTSATQ